MDRVNILERFKGNVKKRPLAKALFVGNKYYSYLELYNRAVSLASKLATTDNKYCAIFANQSLMSYVGMLAAILANKTFVPITSKLSVKVREYILNTLETCDIVVDNSCLEMLGNTLSYKNQECRIFHEEPPSMVEVEKFDDVVTNEMLYLLFTSGTSGFPKGVEVSHYNLSTYIKSLTSYLGELHLCKSLQINDLTFDISMHEIFYCWGVGGCLYVYAEENLFTLPKFIKMHDLNMVTFVPSVVALLKGFRSFHNVTLPNIKISNFAGEALPESLAAFWHSIAPNSSIANLYGPTEATVLFTISTWDPSRKNIHNDIVPIGHVIDPQANVYILDEENKVLEAGETGEIALAGAQVVKGYWRDSEKSQKYFTQVVVDSKPVDIYKTGDLGVYDPSLGLIYKGRKDDQLQIRGIRAERIEIESTIRSLIHCVALTILPICDLQTKLVKGFFLFVVGASETEQRIIKICRDYLPTHMVPEGVVKLLAIPINKNGKINNEALEEIVTPKTVACLN